MELQINGHNLSVTTRIQNYVEKKTARFDRYMPNLSDVRVDLSEQKARSSSQRQIAQITIRDKRGTILRAEEQSNDLFAAIDGVTDKIYRQISRYRGKKRRKWRNSGNQDEFLGEPLPIDEDEENAEQGIVRYKQFAMQPMSEDEAIDQMELLGHDFFIFFNVSESAINVLYRRKDGNYGLLQPEMG